MPEIRLGEGMSGLIGTILIGIVKLVMIMVFIILPVLEIFLNNLKEINKLLGEPWKH